MSQTTRKVVLKRRRGCYRNAGQGPRRKLFRKGQSRLLDHCGELFRVEMRSMSVRRTRGNEIKRRQSV